MYDLLRFDFPIPVVSDVLGLQFLSDGSSVQVASCTIFSETEDFATTLFFDEVEATFINLSGPDVFWDFIFLFALEAFSVVFTIGWIINDMKEAHITENV